jgi:hypothetical protein
MKLKLLLFSVINFFGMYGICTPRLPVQKDYYKGECAAKLNNRCIGRYPDNIDYFACLMGYALGRHPELHSPANISARRNLLLRLMNLYWDEDSCWNCWNVTKMPFSIYDAQNLIVYLNRFGQYRQLNSSNIL